MRPLFALLAVALSGCFAALDTTVVIENRYPPGATAYVVYRASYKEVGETPGVTGAAFDQPIVPGASSDPQPVVAASENPAYVLLAPGWDATSASPPTSFVVLLSRVGFAVRYGTKLRIPVDDTTFAGNCAVGSMLTQADADFITQRIFPAEFGALSYSAARCTTTEIGESRAP